MSSNVPSDAKPRTVETRPNPGSDPSLVPTSVDFVRTYKERKFRPRRTRSGLTLREAFELEREAYRRVSNRPHFPRWIRWSKDPHRPILTHRGTSFDRLPKSASIPDLRNRIETILDGLESSGIVYVDVYPSNMCYDPTTSIVSLIDYDKIVLDCVPSTQMLV